MLQLRKGRQNLAERADAEHPQQADQDSDLQAGVSLLCRAHGGGAYAEPLGEVILSEPAASAGLADQLADLPQIVANRLGKVG